MAQRRVTLAKHRPRAREPGSASSRRTWAVSSPSAAGLSFGGFPQAMSGLRRFPRREHVLFGLGGTCLGRSRPSRAGRKSRPGPLPARTRRIPVPQPHHHGTQAAQAIAIQDQPSTRTSPIRAERIGRLRSHQARIPSGSSTFRCGTPSTCRTA